METLSIIGVWVVSMLLFYFAARWVNKNAGSWTFGRRLVVIISSLLGPIAVGVMLLIVLSMPIFWTIEWLAEVIGRKIDFDKEVKW